MPQLPTIAITNDPTTFRGKADLTDETHDAILTILELEMATTFGADFLKTGVRALSKVYDLAITLGWRPSQAERLETVAGQIYADIFREAQTAIALERQDRKGV